MSTESHPPLLGAVWWRRILAIAYDSLLIFGILLVTLMPVFALTNAVAGDNPPTWVVQSLVLLITFSFYATFWTRWGRTLGGQSWRMQIITPWGTPPTLRQAAIRYFVSLPSLVFLIGYLWALVDRHNRSWPDIASGTTTVYVPSDGAADPSNTAST